MILSRNILASFFRILPVAFAIYGSGIIQANESPSPVPSASEPASSSPIPDPSASPVSSASAPSPRLSPSSSPSPQAEPANPSPPQFLGAGPWPNPWEDRGIELHAHLFMKEGMSWGFQGDFFGPLMAADWRDRFKSQANPEAMHASDLAITVVSLYAHPLFTFSLRESIRRQIELTRRFLENNPGWVLAKTADEAQRAIAARKHVLVLSLEGTAGVIENDQDIEEFVDRAGIRIITLLHLTDDRFGGVAFLRGFRALSSPFAFLSQSFWPKRDGSIRVNRNGLTEHGRQLARKLIERKVWIDLAHSSDASQAELIPTLKAAGQPLLYTHTVLRHHHQAERGISEVQLKEVAESGGLIGLMPSEEMLEGTEVPPAFCHLQCATTCGGGLVKLAIQFIEAARVVGPEAIAMGSDFNGGLPHLAPSCDTATSIDDHGMQNIGQSPDLWKGLSALGAPVPRPLAVTVNRFLRAWSRVTAPVPMSR